jgi:hypothetical protein
VQADAAEHEAERGRLGGNPEVAGQREAAAGADGRPLIAATVGFGIV